MSDVAKRAGVHVTSVSLALRNHPSLPPTTRARLCRLAEKMGYRPDPALSALVAYRHRARMAKDQPTLAYVTNWDTQWGWRDHVAAHRMFFEGATAKAVRIHSEIERVCVEKDIRLETRDNRPQAVIYDDGLQR